MSSTRKSCTKEVKACPTNYSPSSTNINICEKNDKVEKRDEETLKCDNFSVNRNNGNSFSDDEDHVCRVDYVAIEGDHGNPIIIRKYAIEKEISMDRMKILTNDWEKPMSLIAVDGAGKSVIFIKSAKINMKYKKEEKVQRTFYWYLCKKPGSKIPWGENTEEGEDGEEVYKGRSDRENPGPAPQNPPHNNCVVDRYLNCEDTPL